jgi:hypothetical protein
MRGKPVTAGPPELSTEVVDNFVDKENLVIGKDQLET